MRDCILPKRVWTLSQSPIKWDANLKAQMLERVNIFIETTQKLTNIINRVSCRGGRIYLYYLIKPFISETNGVIITKPLIDDKYLEYIYARITVYVKNGSHCSADWCRHTNQWISMHEGTMEECLEFIEADGSFFYYPPFSRGKA